MGTWKQTLRQIFKYRRNKSQINRFGQRAEMHCSVAAMETSAIPMRNPAIGMRAIPLNEITHQGESKMRDVAFLLSYQCVSFEYLLCRLLMG